MAPKHTCLDTFWGKHEVVDALVEMLDNIALRGALDMSDATYHTLCALQREIERATGQTGTLIPGHGAGPSPWPPQDEALLRAAAQAFMAELVKDQYDFVPAPHDAGNADWLDSNGTAQIAPFSAVDALLGGPNSPPRPGPGPDGLITRIRNALGS